MSRGRVQRTIAALALLAAGCGRPTVAPSGSPSGMTLADARRAGLPVVVLAVDPTRGDADRRSLAAFESAVASRRATVVPVVLDLTISRNRALAAPLHGVDAPTLACLTPAGVIVSRDEGEIDATIVRDRIATATRDAATFDREFDRLTAAADASVDARMALADFLLAHHNDARAIPHLRRVADDASADVATRVRAWTAMARAHLWVIEPEKARYAAQALIDTLGLTTPDAIAGGNLVRGLQDARAKRFARARDEFAAAIAAAPDSPYGREARATLDALPAPGTTRPAEGAR